jgi:hypothetical protein
MTAWWRDLVFFNYEVDRGLLSPRVPPGTELDLWHGHALVSLIGLRFLRLSVLGVPVPGHRAFAQINLRFYVRRPLGDGEWRRGVVFIREVVPKALIVSIARMWFGEPYLRLPTRFGFDTSPAGSAFQVRYEWKHHGRWHGVAAAGGGQAAVFAPGSIEEFITERYSGYTRHRAGGTSEFRTGHPPWLVWPLREPRLTGDPDSPAGPEWADALRRPPHSAFMAQGSAVAVFGPRPLSDDDDLPGAAA